ncbi:MAG: hypothetical protein CVU61_15435 [Deltaproteobacteria bacterium HGW-Deltaproteobacteria-19]|nr:MAG: hypothetical protein CVU61_15435 [Deltaproteobacteria bacterium HGW-Deltaproteobacteria-19]
MKWTIGKSPRPEPGAFFLQGPAAGRPGGKAAGRREGGCRPGPDRHMDTDADGPPAQKNSRKKEES